MMKKNIFFSKIIFSQYFWDFSTHQSKDFRDLGDPAMCPYLPYAPPYGFLAAEDSYLGQVGTPVYAARKAPGTTGKSTPAR